jgi:uncharacterized protein
MSLPLPDHADPYRLCEQTAVFSGEIAFINLPRLLPLLVTSEGSASYQVSFGRDADGRYRIAGEVQAVLVLVCQRCMQTMPLPVDITFCVSPVSGPQEAEQLPDGYDPLLVDALRLCPADIIEDELILAIPAAPRHTETQCGVDLHVLNQPVQHIEPAVKENPFAVLASLKHED